MCMGANLRNDPARAAFGNRARGCYKATVNESETINEAKPLCLVRGRRSETSGAQPVSGFRSRPSSNGAELGSVRKCRIALRAWPGDFARPQFPDSRPFLPVPHRPVRCRQDLTPEVAVFVAPTDSRPGQSVRPGRLAARQGSDRRPAQADRYRAAGLPAARPHDYLRERRVAVPRDRSGGVELPQGGHRSLEMGWTWRTNGRAS